MRTAANGGNGNLLAGRGSIIFVAFPERTMPSVPLAIGAACRSGRGFTACCLVLTVTLRLMDA